MQFQREGVGRGGAQKEYGITDWSSWQMLMKARPPIQIKLQDVICVFQSFLSDPVGVMNTMELLEKLQHELTVLERGMLPDA